MKMIERDWLWRVAGVTAAVAVCWANCLLAWILSDLVSEVHLKLPAILEVVAWFAGVITVSCFIPLTGYVMGWVAAWFWRHTQTDKLTLNNACYVTGGIAYSGGFFFFRWGWIAAFFTLLPLLIACMWCGLDAALEWLPRQPWRYFCGQTPYPPEKSDIDF